MRPGAGHTRTMTSEPSDTAPTAFSADGYGASWSTWDLAHQDDLTLEWENEAWTASGQVGREGVHYVIRLSALWHVRQFLLFRDLAEPDLWLGTDGHGRWGELNGAHRPDLDGAIDIALDITPFTHTLPIRRLPLQVGDGAELRVLRVDVDTLGVVPESVVYERVGVDRWRYIRHDVAVEFTVDAHGVPLDLDGRFRRLPQIDTPKGR